MRKGIETAISRYGAPEIVAEGQALRVRVGGQTDAQCLFAIEREGKMSRPVGVILYVRDSFERITVLHLVVAEAYAVGGPRVELQPAASPRPGGQARRPLHLGHPPRRTALFAGNGRARPSPDFRAVAASNWTRPVWRLS